MELRILKVILWPKDTTKSPRTVELELDQINVLTGRSQKGKSALISIIDYALGSSKCTIPVGIIREKTEWFGLLLQLEHTQLLVARREPRLKDQTSDAYFYEESVVGVPEILRQNANITAVKERLNQAAGMPYLNFVGEDEVVGYRARPSFRDTAALNFLPQHIVANPYTLFFKADTAEHQQKLRTIFPLLLAAIDAESLALKRELQELTRQLLRMQRDQQARRAAADRWVAELRATYIQAQELGLIPNAQEPQAEWSAAAYITRLSRIPQLAFSDQQLQVPAAATERAVSEIQRLSNEESRISQAIASSRAKLVRMNSLTSSTDTYATALATRKDRLAPSGWFAERLKQRSNACPFCGNQEHAVADHLEQLVQVAEAVERSSEASEHTRIVLDRESAEVKSELRRLEAELNEVRRARIALTNPADRNSDGNRQTLPEIYRFVGRLEQSLENMRLVDLDSDLSREIADAEAEVRRLNRLLDPNAESQRLRYALTTISRYINAYAEIIGIENPKANVELDLANLTLRISTAEGRSDFLWEIGSAANWMGYHISTLLALHEFFFSLGSGSHVAPFLVIDQPSQAYFPESWPEELDEPDAQIAPPRGTASDVESVSRIFQTLAAGLARMNKRLQIFVVEHAGDITWKGIEGVHVVDRWHEDKALIPADW